MKVAFSEAVHRLSSITLMGDATPMLWLAKLVGALAGSLISIAYILPRGRREAVLRFLVGLATGLVFGGTAGVKIADSLNLLGKISPTEVAMMGASLASLSAWWGLGVLQRISENWAMNRPWSTKTPSVKKDHQP